MNNTTSSKNGFRVEDVTFKKARMQNEILNEGVSDTSCEPVEVKVPESLTPEQVKQYLAESVKSMEDTNKKKKVYAQMFNWINELLELRKKIRKYELDEMRRRDSSETPSDIQEVRNEFCKKYLYYGSAIHNIFV